MKNKNLNIKFIGANFSMADMKWLLIGLTVVLLACTAKIEKKELPKGLEEAIFAGGCFWCIESDFEKIDGVVEAISGYSGGEKQNPSYSEVSSGTTGHAESVKVLYDPKKVSYKELVEAYWKMIDPTDPNGQFVDRGSQYRTVIFYNNEEQRKIAEESLKNLNSSGRYDKPIVTEIVPLEKFYTAESYHQDYHIKNPVRYNVYRFGSGRDQFLKKVWGNAIEKSSNVKKYEKPSDDELKKKLTPMQYEITQKGGTEPAFDNEYWDNHEDGIYVDIVSGEPLFSSKDKFDSGTGWPSFTKPLEPGNVVEKVDYKLLYKRTEIRSKNADSHLGHVFNDGPEPTGLRYCMNSAALRFIPKDKLKEEGYEEYLGLFDEA